MVPERRYWPHAIWLVCVLLVAAVLWWNFWSFKDVHWNFLRFLLTLFIAASIYLQAAALVPESPGSVQSWREHFFAARKRFFVALASCFLLIAFNSWLLLDLPMAHPARVIQALAFGFALSGAISAHEGWHRALPVIFLALVSIAAVALFLQPGSLASQT
jgi:hypothetical protein